MFYLYLVVSVLLRSRLQCVTRSKYGYFLNYMSYVAHVRFRVVRHTTYSLCTGKAVTKRGGGAHVPGPGRAQKFVFLVKHCNGVYSIYENVHFVSTEAVVENNI
jgi:hypothetical protein